MKKALKITGIILLSIFIILLILPSLFEEKIVEKVKQEANNRLNAKVNFSTFNLSFIRHFPNASISVNDFSVVGIKDFKKDTLASIDKFTIVLNIKSIMGKNKIEVSKIKIENPRIYAKVLPNGQENWNIIKPSKEVDTTKTSFRLKVNNVSIEKGHIVFDDAKNNIHTKIENLEFDLSGDLTQNNTNLKTVTKIEKISVEMKNVSYLKKAKIKAKINLDADFKNNKFIFSDNVFQLNAIKLNLNGWVAIIDKGYKMDVKLNAPKTEFKDLLSMVPIIYTKDFDKIKTDGKISIDAAVKGTYTNGSSVFPSFEMKVKVSDAYLKYSDLPKSVDNINIVAEVKNPGGDIDLTKVDISKFHFEVAKNTFDFYLNLATPISDPAINAGAKGVLNLNFIKEIFPLEKGMEISGIVKADMNFGGRLSYIKNEQYESFTANGSLNIANLNYISNNFKPVHIKDISMNFTPKYINLTNLNIKIGNNDVEANGKLENFVAYILRNETISGDLNVNSSSFNLNDFISDKKTVEATTTEKPLSVIEVPKNVNFTMNGNFKKVTYEKIVLENINGIIKVADGKIAIQDANMNAFGGNMTMNGDYTAADVSNPEVNMTLNIKDILYSEAYKQSDLVKNLAPIFEKMGGKFSSDINFNAKLGKDMMPNYPSIKGSGTILSKDFSVSDVKVLDALATALKNEKLKTFKADNVKINFAIADGKINIQPFDVKMGTIKMNLSGSTWLDQTIDYVGKIEFPQTEQSTQTKVDIKIGGTFAKPIVKTN
jgi:hypothetical protein